MITIFISLVRFSIVAHANDKQEQKNKVNVARSKQYDSIKKNVKFLVLVTLQNPRDRRCTSERDWDLKSEQKKNNLHYRCCSFCFWWCSISSIATAACCSTCLFDDYELPFRFVAICFPFCTKRLHSNSKSLSLQLPGRRKKNAIAEMITKRVTNRMQRKKTKLKTQKKSKHIKHTSNSFSSFL